MRRLSEVQIEHTDPPTTSYPPVLTLPFFSTAHLNVGAGITPDDAAFSSSVLPAARFCGSEDLMCNTMELLTVLES
ncbi:hypothetical protein ACFX1X_026918 [Malus domestica]